MIAATSVATDLALYVRLLGYVRGHWLHFSLSLIGFSVYAGSHVAFAELLVLTVDSIRAFNTGVDISRERLLIPLGMVAAVGARGLGSFMGVYFLNKVGTSVVHRLRCDLFDKLLVLPSAYYDANSHGHLVSRVTYTVTQVTGAATKAVEVVAREGLTILGLTAWLMWMNWKLALVFFAIAPVIAWIVRFAARRFRRFSQRIQGAMGNVTQVASEAVSGFREVRTFGGEDYERARFRQASAYNKRQSMKMATTSALSTPVIQLLVAIALGILIWLILEPGMLAGMTEGDVVGFITAAGLLAKPIRQLSEISAVIQRGLAASEDIFAQMDEPPEPDKGVLEPDRVAGRIEFDGVHFRYPGAETSLFENLSLAVAPGETVALVGRSGSGKSTLVGLIPRFHDCDGGVIRIDGEPLERYRRASLRRQVALVSQSVVLFNDSVLRNIAYGSLNDATREQVEAAARRAYAWEFIERLPDGLDTRIGDDGVRLSGGQRQRLAIARAILKDAPILILDEATSALDSESEQHIQAALAEVMRDRTTLVIAHRLSTVERADRILVMEQGRIEETGTHAALLAANGAYARFYHRQFEDLEPLDPALQPARQSVVTEYASAPSARPPLVADIGQAASGIHEFWARESLGVRLLAPLGRLTARVARRRHAARPKRRAVDDSRAPVIVVGNISVGGTGKTPFVIWLANFLAAHGRRPGVVSRGYGGTASSPLSVTAATSAALAGDEAPLIALRTGLPVVVARDRPAGVQCLLEAGVNVVISDDGLQHHALARDLEIVMLDGARGLGNGRCLPAGPLREAPERLASVDLVVSLGDLRAADATIAHHVLTLQPVDFIGLDGSIHGLHDVPRGPVHAVAGIGHPERFFLLLETLGFDLVRHPFADHHVFRSRELRFDDPLPIIMTEKDMVRCRKVFASWPRPWRDRCLAMRVEVVPSADLLEALGAHLERLGIGVGGTVVGAAS